MGNCFSTSSADRDSYLVQNEILNDNEDSSVPVADLLHIHPNLSHRYEQDVNPVYHPNPGRSCPLSQMSEAEQIRIAKRMGLLSHLPMEIYTPDSKGKLKECIICMCEYIIGEELRYLPCLHTFHRTCIDDWLMRSFTCPSCLEPVETGLLATF